MAGTLDGGKQASITNRERYGEDFYKKIGAKGGKNGRTGGFYARRDIARSAGKIGGQKSSRKGVKNVPKL